MNRNHIIRNLRAKGIEFDANLSTKELNDLLNQAGLVNKVSRVTDFTNGRGNIKVSYNAAKADESVQVMVCEDIGKRCHGIGCRFLPERFTDCARRCGHQAQS